MGAFEPLRQRGFSLYFAGQVVSNVGTWFQNLALQLVVLAATGSAQTLSGVTIAQFLPILVFGVAAGRLADRVRPRTILLCTSALAAGVTAALALVVGEPDPGIPVLYALVAVLGTVQAFERIAGQAIIFELVGAAALARAVSISTIALAAARSIGPGLAGIAFAQLGASACMLLNAASFVAVGLSLLLIRPASLHERPARSDAAPVRTTDLLRHRSVSTLLIANVVIALFAMNFGLVLTATVDLSYGGDATAVGATHALNAIGAIIGGGIAAALPRVDVRSLAPAAAVFGGALLLNAAAPTLALFLLAGPVLGLAIGYYQGVLNAAAQSSVAPAAIGRVMSLVTLGNYGMVPFGALLMGWVIDASSGLVSLLIGGVAALACAVLIAVRAPRA
ncbi:MFS transporter [Microbacterium stercoris]|uniref:MFS transporter n=1 Tax=Microbacterium stercoris TaxID=2820289 RepID=A0A939QHT5_9MICO|nr:MFS transporter [Microbacterium stercoris]MBO3663187.1 MFS transporter [Microbacterium stercoris]